jgi:hypothetical protein
MQQGEGWRGFCMMLKHARDLRADDHLLFRRTKQIAEQANAGGVLHQHDEIRRRAAQGRVDRMPDMLPAVDPPAWREVVPTEREGVAMVTHPFRSPLRPAAIVAALHTDIFIAQFRPIRRAETVSLWNRDGQAECQVGHNVDSDRSMRLLTGVTIVPSTSCWAGLAATLSVMV